ncbi:MAG: TIGR02281 family clan AA aspartic protease [Pseudomonadota bacterium]
MNLLQVRLPCVASRNAYFIIMETYDLARLGYLALLGFAVGGWLMLEHRRSAGVMFKQAMVWVFIFLAIIAGVGLWGDIRQEIAPHRQMVFTGDTTRIETERAWDGHYYLEVEMNGVPLTLVVDTGATAIVLSQQDARQLGIETADLMFTGVAGTANGEVRTASVRINEVILGNMLDRNVPALVNSGEMDTSLLGMSYLQKFSRIEIADNTLVLER